AVAASRAAGACDGQVVLPPEPVEAPYGLSPNSRVMSRGCRPRITATTMAVTVRWPVPRSWEEVRAVTEPSWVMVTVHSLAWGLAWPPQVCSAMPMPCLIGPFVLPGGCHFSFHLESSAAIWISLV